MVDLGRRLVPDVQGGHLLHRVERQEAHGREEHGRVQRSQLLDRLGHQVEERSTDADAGPDGDDQPDGRCGAHGQQPARQRREERAQRDEDRRQLHRHRFLLLR